MRSLYGGADRRGRGLCGTMPGGRCRGSSMGRNVSIVDPTQKNCLTSPPPPCAKWGTSAWGSLGRETAHETRWSG